MSNQIDILAPKSGLLFRSATRLIDFAFLLGAKPALSIKLVTAIFYFPFFFATLAAFALAIRTLATRDLRQPLPVAICFMILAAVPILVLERGLSYIHVAFAFPLILGAVSLPWPRLPHIRMANLSGVTARVFVACALLVSGALWNLTHAAKFAVFPGEFLEPRRMLAALNGAMSTVDAVFVARPELAPFLMPAFEEQYHGSTGRLSPRQPEANFLFQALANIGNPEGAARASALIVRRVERHRPERTLWLLAKKNIPSTASDGFCLTLGDGGDILDLSLRFTIAEVLYESNKHVVLRPASVSFGC